MIYEIHRGCAVLLPPSSGARLGIDRSFGRFFSVVGGASRTIDLTSANDISVTSELEQARIYKNITIFFPPKNNFFGVNLIGLRTPVQKRFDIFFRVYAFTNAKSNVNWTHSVQLIARNAWLHVIPVAVGGVQGLLMAKVRFDAAKLSYNATPEGEEEEM